MSHQDAQPRPEPGFVAPEVAAEFPGLRLDWVTADARPGHSPPALVAQLARLASRYRGASVVTMRTKAIPRAYRSFFRQIGLDPDVERIPSERVAVERLVRGGFPSVDVIADACLAALVETGVPVWALDAARVGPPGLGIALVDGRLAVADSGCVHAALFADPRPESAVRATTRRVALYSLAVDGVPAIHVEEALWIALEPLLTFA